MIRTNVPMIDVFNCLVESQKIPILSVSGEPHDQLLARIGIQADADVVVFGDYAAAGSNDFQRIAKAIEELDRSGPPVAANPAVPSAGAAASPPVAAVGEDVATKRG